MFPTLQTGDGLLVSGVDYFVTSPARGDIVVIREQSPGGRYFIKRIVGLPGETIRFTNNTLHVNGGPVDELYLPEQSHVLGLEDQEWELGEGDYFVLGDNRTGSTDSRTRGPIHRSRIIGRSWLCYWPLHRSGSPK